ncbi:hypothetical protein JZU71_02600, partial [bacterium]|nr:hypothetical protein [bacterium]
MAFCLSPRLTPAVESVLNWIAEQRHKQRVIVGFNLHLMLLDAPDACDEVTAIKVAAQTLARLIQERHAAVVLIPHDFRGDRNDQTMLADC